MDCSSREGSIWRVSKRRFRNERDEIRGGKTHLKPIAFGVVRFQKPKLDE